MDRSVSIAPNNGAPPKDYGPRAPLYPVATAKRRAHRASQACDSCRELKAKCNEGRPCENCQDRGVECHYQDLLEKPKDRTILDAIKSLEARLTETFQAELKKIILAPPVRDQCPKDVATASLEGLPTRHEKPDFEAPLSVEQTRGAIPENIHAVLESRSVRKLMQDSSSQVGYGSVLPGRDTDEAIRPSVAASPIDGWSQASTLTPPPSNDWHGGNLNAKQNPRWNPETVERYVQSFKHNVLDVYPFIDPIELDDMISAFLRTEICAASPFEARTAGQKRKRSFVAERYSPIPNHGRLLQTEEYALCLLVLALGQLCIRRDEISDAAEDSKARSRNHFRPSPNSPTSPEEDRNGGTHARASRRSSLPSAVLMRASPYPYSGVPNQGGMSNLDYFTLAMGTGQMSRFCQCQHVCNHVSIHLLVGFYYASLGRLPESWSYISLASQRIQAIVPCTLDRILRYQIGSSYAGESTKDNQLILDFWICLGLEGDILVTLPMPPSGLRQHEAQMPYPNLKLATSRGVPRHAIESYIAQLYLRKQLALVHDSFKHTKFTSREDAIKVLQGALKDTRDTKQTWVPQGSRWKDGDPPTKDAPSARLRAMYWITQIVLYIPFLRVVLESEAVPANLYPVPPPVDTWIGPDVDDVKIKQDTRTISYAKLAIEALVENTRAFHGIDRSHLVILNLLNMAHTQCKNLLILAACSYDPILSEFIDRETLRTLFDWTISLIQMIPYPSSELVAQTRNLIHAEKHLGFTHG
ncbi:uncharacterized protein F4822DRAFT_435427 [Hypoxylon trugodes]|uniref:uncharacterized protein n=1 Tax=Hypoxylon trugodes TaxID=326681 RepID=UPI00219C400B|nr:uncharacterized protein F4822DRAFT_435427 [Hypoxylon trugodes]KAI1382598.1 hypothetical protein F4822DRAFT_435427 [Hypoxylon trugodes]